MNWLYSREEIHCCFVEESYFPNVQDIDAYMKKVYYEVNTKLNFPIGRPTRQEREQTIYALYERGFFNLKDSIDFVSKKLFCSTSTVYRYIALAEKK